MKKHSDELAIQLTYDILAHKLGVIERDILKGHGLIEVSMILHSTHVLGKVYKTRKLSRV